MLVLLSSFSWSSLWTRRLRNVTMYNVHTSSHCKFLFEKLSCWIVLCTDHLIPLKGYSLIKLPQNNLRMSNWKRKCLNNAVMCSTINTSILSHAGSPLNWSTSRDFARSASRKKCACFNRLFDHVTYVPEGSKRRLCHLPSLCTTQAL